MDEKGNRMGYKGIRVKKEIAELRQESDWQCCRRCSISAELIVEVEIQTVCRLSVLGNTSTM